MGKDLRSKDTGENVANDTANTVDSKDIEGLVDADEELELGGEVAADTADDADDEGTPGGDEASGRGDGNEAGDGAGAEANGGPLTLQAEIEQYPGQGGHGGGELGVVAGHDGADVHAQGGTAVETEPADPEEDGAKDDVGDIVGAPGHTGVLRVARTLSEHQGVGQGAGTGGDVDRTATGEVEGAELEQPAVGVPSLVGNGVVDDGGPDEHKDKARQDAAAVGDSTDSQGRRDGSKHALVQAEEDVWEDGAAGLSDDISETDHIHVAEEGVAGAGEG